MASLAKDFIEIIQEIRGTTFDENGIPQTGYWADIKGWHTTVNTQQADVNTKYSDFTSVQLPLALSYKTEAETAATNAEIAQASSESARDISILNTGYAQEWAIAVDPVSVAAGGNASTTYSAKHYADLSKVYYDAVNPYEAEILAAGINATTATTQATLASNWATLTTAFVTGVSNSAKSWAVGGTDDGNPLLGSAKDWATKLDASVPSNSVEYSAKEYAIGNTVSTGSAKKWASNPENSLVSGTLYSALHYATKASASAVTASSQAAIATTKATEASASAEAASDSEADTLTYRNTAITKATEAAASASQAAISATGAASSAVTAGQQATLAASYATDAQSSQVAAEQSESDASTHATNALNSASAANTSAINAAASASTATSEATNSSNSAATAASQAEIATTKATEATTARNKAWGWSSSGEDILVSDGINPDGYSAYHWMKKAQAVVGGITDFTDLGDVPTSYTGYAGRYVRVNGTSNGLEFDTLTKEDISLANVDNTSDLNKPISIATQAALDTKTNTSTTTALDVRVTSLEDNTAGITNQAVAGTYPLRIQVDKPMFISDAFTLRTYSNLQDRELIHTLAVKNMLAAETIGAY